MAASSSSRLQPAAEVARPAFADRHLDAGMAALERGEEAHDARRPQRRHHADAHRRLVQQPQAFRRALHRVGALQHLGQQRLHLPAELGQPEAVGLTEEQRAAQLGLQLFHCRGQRRLRHVALLGGAGEAERGRGGEEVADLVHFHQACPTPFGAASARNGRAVTQAAVIGA